MTLSLPSPLLLHLLLLLLLSPLLHQLLALCHSLAPGVVWGVGADREAGVEEEAEEGYGVCWSSLQGVEFSKRERKEGK